MSYHDEERIYELQRWLRAIKRCEMCELWLPVDDFDMYGVQPCDECYTALERHRHSPYRMRDTAGRFALA